MREKQVSAPRGSLWCLVGVGHESCHEFSCPLCLAPWPASFGALLEDGHEVHPRVHIKDSLSYETMVNHFITSSLPAEAG